MTSTLRNIRRLSRFIYNLSFEFDPTQNQGSFRDFGADFPSKIAPSAMISEKSGPISSKISLDCEGNEPKTQVIKKTPLLLTRKGKSLEMEIAPDALKRYLLYAEKALQTPSPFFPQPLQDDSIIQWAQKRALLPPHWADSWDEYIQEHLHELI